jgi:hypothetical protein
MSWRARTEVSAEAGRQAPGVPAGGREISGEEAFQLRAGQRIAIVAAAGVQVGEDLQAGHLCVKAAAAAKRQKEQKEREKEPPAARSARARRPTGRKPACPPPPPAPGIVIAQDEVAKSGTANEITRFKPLLEPLPLDDVLTTCGPSRAASRP